jgi:polysaccharide export outer membrane protein
MRLQKNANRIRGRIARALTVLAAGGAVLLFAAGCQTVPNSVRESHEVLAAPPDPDREIVISPGDELEIQFFYTETLSTIQTVRPDGVISLKLIGDLYVAGKTPSDIKGMIVDNLRRYIDQIDVTIVVRELHQRQVFVGGAVDDPGSVEMPGSMTALEALLRAGGINPVTGAPKSVLIIRNSDGRWVGGKLDMKDVLRGVGGQPFYLQPLDIVYVPEKGVVRVNRWIEQNIDRILPTVGFSYTFRPGFDTWGVSTSIDTSDDD